MRISGSGNTILAYTGSDSGELLQVNGTAKITGLSSFGNTIQVAGGANIPASGAGLELAGGTSGTFLTSFNRTSGTYLTSGFNALSYSFLISGVEKFVITSSGWTGAGTNAPKTILDVYSNSDIWHFMAGGATSKLLVGGQGTGGVVLQGGAGSSVNNAAVSSPYNIILQRDGGNVLIGSTSDSGELLQVNGTAKITGALSGLSGRFSSSVSVDVLNLTSTYASKIGLYNSSSAANMELGTNTSTSGAIVSRLTSYNVNNGNSGNESSTNFMGIVSLETQLQGTNGGNFILKTKGDGGTLDTRLTIASTGSATFSSSVTATQFNAVNDRNFLGRGSFRLTSASDNASTLDISVTNGTTSIYSNYYGGGSDNTIIIATYANIGNQLVLKPSGNILIGSTTDSGEKLQVTGTMKVTGASVFGSTVTSAGYRLSGDGTLLLNSIAAVQSQQIQYQNNGTNKWQLYLNTSNNNFSFFNYLQV
jgi:hypothetical protein